MNDFHFLRPWWLLAMLPCMAIVWRLYAVHDPVHRWRKVIAPDLLPHLLVHAEQRRRVSPIGLLSVCWSFLVLALSGPTWQREPAPFGDDTAVLVIVLKVTPSMQEQDIQPTRLARSVEKIHDLLALRPGAKTALVAYSGTAHQVMPLTTDAGIISSFAAELSPDVMPTEGDSAAAALGLADQLVMQSGSRGWILWIADGVNAGQLGSLQKREKTSSVPVTVLATSKDGPERQSLLDAAAPLNLTVVSVSPDDSDVKKLSSNTRFSTATEATGERWRDNGYWLVPGLCLFCLGWFRRGWVIGEAS
jgi:Ca-activated chloride channel family protein